MGIRILPPDINRSNAKFSVENGCIRFGLLAVKSVGAGAIACIEENRRQKGDFRDLFDYVARVPSEQVNKKAIDSLIRAGAFDSLAGTRAQKLAVYEHAVDAVGKRNKNALAGQLSLFDAFEEEEPEPPKFPDLPEMPHRELLAMEKEVTGVYISGHPLDDHREKLAAFETNSQIIASMVEDSEDGGLKYDQLHVDMGGILSGVKTKVTKNDQIMAFVQLEDLYGSTEAIVFPRVYDKYRSMLVNDNIVILSGKLSIREDEAPKLLLESVRSIDSALPSSKPAAQTAAKPRMLYLKLNRAQFDNALAILAKTPGSVPITIRVADEGRTLRAPDSFNTSENFDLDALTLLLGEGNIVLK